MPRRLKTSISYVIIVDMILPRASRVPSTAFTCHIHSAFLEQQAATVTQMLFNPFAELFFAYNTEAILGLAADFPASYGNPSSRWWFVGHWCPPPSDDGDGGSDEGEEEGSDKDGSSDDGGEEVAAVSGMSLPLLYLLSRATCSEVRIGTPSYSAHSEHLTPSC